MNDVVPVGKVIAILQTDGSTATKTPSAASSPKVEEVKQPEKREEAVTQRTESKPVSDEARFYSPLVMNIARSEGISMSELEAISGTGAENRVTKRDILNYIREKKEGKISVKETPRTREEAPKEVETKKEEVAYSGPAVSTGGNVEIIEMDRMRKLIADHMVMSKRTSAM